MPLLAGFTYVHANVLNLDSILSLGLAVDYSLIIVSRFRDELAAGREPHDAVVRTMQTAGVTVFFSATAVSIAIAAIGLFPAHLNSFAFGSFASVTAGLGALIVLPALLAVLGHNVDPLRLFKWTPTQAGEGFWHRLATAVMRRPVPIAIGCVLFLLMLGAPFVRVHISTPDERGLPAGTSSRQALAEIRANISSNDSSALSIVAPTATNPAAVRAELTRYAAQLSAIAGVARVDAYSGTFSGGQQVTPETPMSEQRFSDPTGTATWLSLVPTTSVAPLSAAGEHLVNEVRHMSAPFPVKVGGQSAGLVDTKTAILGRMPLALCFIALVTLITLFLLFGSVLVPVKGVVLNVLSLTATMGAMVWVFQEGHGAGLLGFTPTGSLDLLTPIIVFCVAFGLSMDYEVFLLSRIKEEHDRGRDNIDSVAMGLERTGPIVTAAAACLIVVFLSLLMGGVTVNKVFALGMTLAVLVDATVIRGLLVPAFMRLAGNANWWAPRSLRHLHQRFGFSETSLARQPPSTGEVLTLSHQYDSVTSDAEP
jgi:RND superfamily putative drug exporter